MASFFIISLAAGVMLISMGGSSVDLTHVLFGSILLYSVANILNAFVTDMTQYTILRFLAGIGLAGELGAGITLVSEIIPKEKRGYSTAIVAAVGVSGAVVANFVATMGSWQTAYIVGGVMGLALLVLRLKVFESGMFDAIKEQAHVSRGNFMMLFTNWQRFTRYAACILIGIPIWYVVAILVIFSPEFAKSMGAVGAVSAGAAISWCYGGLVIGDLISGFMSQALGSRRRIVGIFMLFSARYWWPVTAGLRA